MNQDEDFADDFKTRFQEKAQQICKRTPSYRVREASGPDHQKTFIVEVILGDQVVAEGAGGSKKIAEQMAARRGLEVMKWQ